VRRAVAGLGAIAALAAVLAAPAAGAEHDPRIVGGEIAQPGAYPWAVSRSEAGTEGPAGHGCGGSLVSATMVLTAAHCVGGITPDDVDAVVGRDRLDDAADGERVDVTRYALHPGQFDLALLELGTPVSQPPVGLATLAEAALFAPGETATAIGWGLRSENGSAPSNDLRQVDVPIVGDADCRSAYRGFARIQPSSSICAGSAGHDTCSGDSGGPLFVHDASGTPLQVGVTSFGRGCARARFPGVYMEVPAALDFVTDPDPVFAPIPERRLAKVRGTSRVGEPLTCDEGAWAGEDIKFRYRWFGGFRPAPVGREREFTPGEGLAGKRVNCEVLAHNEGGFVPLVSLPVRVHGNG